MKRYCLILLFLFCTTAVYAQQYSLYQGNYNTGFSGTEAQCENEIDRRCDAERRRQLGGNSDGLSATLVDKYIANYRDNFNLREYAGGSDEIPESPAYNTNTNTESITPTGNPINDGLNAGLTSAAANLGSALGEAAADWIAYGIQRAIAASRERRQLQREEQEAIRIANEKFIAALEPSKVTFERGAKWADMADRRAETKPHVGAAPDEDGSIAINVKIVRGKTLAMEKATDLTKKVLAQKAAVYNIKPLLDYPEYVQGTADKLFAAMKELMNKENISIEDVGEYDRKVTELVNSHYKFVGKEVKKRL